MKVIGIISRFNPHVDKKAHSGILFKINEAIENAGFKTVWVKNSQSKPFVFLCKVFALLKMLRLVNNVNFIYTKLGARLMAKTIDKKAIKQCDYLVAIHYFHVPAYLRTDKPIIYHSDATFELANNYYFHNLPKWNERQGNIVEQMALDNSAYHLSSSVWRQNSVIKTYKQDEKKCFVLEYGPCMDIKDVEHKFSDDGVLRLFFSGVDWERKGGDIAAECVMLLNEHGIKSELTIVGPKQIPEKYKGNKYIIYKGFLDKNNSGEYKILEHVYQTSDIFILPTKAECSAIVYCEASTFGLPIVTYDTGGVGNYVVNGVNGYRLPELSSANIFALKIENIIKNDELMKLSEGARKYAKEKLNWDNWTRWFIENIK